MQVEYDLVQDDYVALNIHLNTHRSTGRRLAIARWILMVLQIVLLGVVFYPQLASGGIGLVMGLLPIVGVAGLWIVVVPYVYRRWITSQVQAAITSQKTGLGHHSLTLTSQGIADRTQQGESTTSWYEVEELVTTHDHAFFYTSVTTAHVVPRRAFANDDAYDAFVEQATELRESIQRHRSASELGKEPPHGTPG
jgi:hypothetical protein